MSIDTPAYILPDDLAWYANNFRNAESASWRYSTWKELDAFVARHIARAVAAEREACAGKRMITQWQPIETAPKDGTTVLLYCASSTVQVTGGYWCNYGRPACWIAGGYMLRSRPPTHWATLPEAPKVEA